MLIFLPNKWVPRSCGCKCGCPADGIISGTTFQCSLILSAGYFTPFTESECEYATIHNKTALEVNYTKKDVDFDAILLIIYCTTVSRWPFLENFKRKS